MVQVRKLSGQGPLSARVEIIRPDSSVLVARDVTTINRQYDNNPDVTLTSSSEALRTPTCGTWKVRFSKRGENSANGEATIYRFYSFAPIINEVPMFGVTQGPETPLPHCWWSPQPAVRAALLAMKQVPRAS